MFRQPPYPTLFPYTTLFRSHYYLDQLASLGYIDKHFPLTSQRPKVREVRYRLLDPFLRFWLDRKSTRLNSSQRWILYSVFFFEKKKRMTRTNIPCSHLTAS